MCHTFGLFGIMFADQAVAGRVFASPSSAFCSYQPTRVVEGETAPDVARTPQRAVSVGAHHDKVLPVVKSPSVFSAQRKICCLSGVAVVKVLLGGVLRQFLDDNYN
jgi:hypothetical protein